MEVQTPACDRRSNEHVSFLFNTLGIIGDSTFPSCLYVTEMFGLNKIWSYSVISRSHSVDRDREKC